MMALCTGIPAHMIPSLLLSILVMSTAFSVGYAVRRTGICAVAAASQSILQRRHVRMRAYFLVACWAGAFVLPAAWLFPEMVHLSRGYPLTAMVLIGGAIFGLGAYVNSACAFGTLAHLSGGNTNFLGTIAGLFVGALIATLIATGQQATYPSVLSKPSALPLLTGLAFFGIAATTLMRLGRRRRRPSTRLWNRRLGASTALVVIGVGGAALYAVAGEWTYMSILSGRAARLVTSDGSSGIAVTAVLGTLAAAAGAVFAAVRSGRFRLTPLRPISCGKKLAGGTAMGFGAAIIPGGNDIMLVYSLPSAAGHAIAAYAAMMAVLCGFFALKAWGSRHRRFWQRP